MAARTGSKNKRSYLAIDDLERLGCNPIEKLLEIAQMNIDAYRSGRGLSDRGDAGPAYLANATRVYIELAKFKHPTLSAVAVKDISDLRDDKKPMSTADAIEVLKSDPFAPKDFKEIPTEKILDAMTSTINAPALPIGKKD